MNELFNLLLTLLITCIANILLGTFYNVKVQDLDFDFMIFLNGIYKALIVAVGFGTLYYVMWTIPTITTELGIDAKVMMYCAIAIYVKNIAVQLVSIFNAQKKEVKNVE